VGHLQEEAKILFGNFNMQIGAADDDLVDLQEQGDYYFKDYNDEDEEQAEEWEEKVFGSHELWPLPEFLHAPNQRGKKRRRMQCPSFPAVAAMASTSNAEPNAPLTQLESSNL
jgi:hypothetical protein